MGIKISLHSADLTLNVYCLVYTSVVLKCYTCYIVELLQRAVIRLLAIGTVDLCSPVSAATIILEEKDVL